LRRTRLRSIITETNSIIENSTLKNKLHFLDKLDDLDFKGGNYDTNKM